MKLENKSFLEMEQDELLRWIPVPLTVDLLNMARNEPARFMRDVVSLPTKSLNPYITSLAHINNCFRANWLNPFDDKINKIEENWSCAIQDPYYRYIHIDLARKKDSACLTMVHAPSFVEVKVEDGVEMRPLIHVDIMIRVQPPKVGEINLFMFVEFVKELRAKGFNIRLVSFDKYQSASLIQALREEGFVSDVLSIDKTDYTLKLDSDHEYRVKHVSTKKDYAHAYHNLKNAIMENRLILPYNPHFYEEISYLEEDLNTKLVSVPTKLPDDLIQTVAGAITNLTSNERYMNTNAFNDANISPEVLDAINREKGFKKGIYDDYYNANLEDFGLNNSRW